VEEPSTIWSQNTISKPQKKAKGKRGRPGQYARDRNYLKYMNFSIITFVLAAGQSDK
jgi:hypothetical protein